MLHLHRRFLDLRSAQSLAGVVSEPRVGRLLVGAEPTFRDAGLWSHEGRVFRVEREVDEPRVNVSKDINGTNRQPDKYKAA
jgi:hypothetical protein